MPTSSHFVIHNNQGRVQPRGYATIRDSWVSSQSIGIRSTSVACSFLAMSAIVTSLSPDPDDLDVFEGFEDENNEDYEVEAYRRRLA